ncbi:MAG TPA: hypothetical protein VMZ91_08150 [Candidatus Paceibacterota bacterium]|nr:hypothetical protein [Candidatus Paceibacterota bacterium]
MININHYGEYRLGLTNNEIRGYLTDRYNELLSWRGKPIKKINKATWDGFWKIAGVNTMAVVQKGNKKITLMYRHDVKRFSDVLFEGKKTYFD